MTTRMEKVAEDIALTALGKAGYEALTALHLEASKGAFQALWPIPDSTRPMNDAINTAAQAASNCTGQDAETWQSKVGQVWQPAVEEVVEVYLKTALHSFERGDIRQGAETLTDAVRATLGSIAASRNWPHSSDDNLFRAAAALGSETGWPQTTEEFDQSLASLSKEGHHLNSALGASMGLPSSIAFGTYLEDPKTAEESGLSFARTIMDLAKRLAGQEPATA